MDGETCNVCLFARAFFMEKIMQERQRRRIRNQRIKMGLAFMGFVTVIPAFAWLSADTSAERQEKIKISCQERGAVTDQGDRGQLFNPELDAECLRFITPTAQRQDLVHGG